MIIARKIIAIIVLISAFIELFVVWQTKIFPSIQARFFSQYENTYVMYLLIPYDLIILSFLIFPVKRHGLSGKILGILFTIIFVILSVIFIKGLIYNLNLFGEWSTVISLNSYLIILWIFQLLALAKTIMIFRSPSVSQTLEVPQQ